MYLTSLETILTILAVAFGTMLTRFLPFILFPENKDIPSYITHLGKALPPAMMGLLVVYCLKNVSLTVKSYGLCELISIITIIILHKWKSNTLLSIGCGTAMYMFLLQIVFV